MADNSFSHAVALHRVSRESSANAGSPGRGAEASNAAELLFLPGYSPNLNLIERLWKFTKKKALRAKYHADCNC